MCTETLPTCTFTSGVQASILNWNDGDTVWVRLLSDGTCNDREWSADSKGEYAWRNVRHHIRVLGIDAPECTKTQNKFYYYECTQDSTYTNDNERFGYESWSKVNSILPFGSSVILTCDQKDSKTGICSNDATGNRKLSYIGYTKNNASYDIAMGNGSRRPGICEHRICQTTSKIGKFAARKTKPLR